MKKKFKGILIASMLALSGNAVAWWGGNGWDWNPWPVWTPMYWMDEMFNDDDYYGYGPYGGYAPSPYGFPGHGYAPTPWGYGYPGGGYGPAPFAPYYGPRY